jgi:DNA-binding transcriptional regulator YiaG
MLERIAAALEIDSPQLFSMTTITEEAVKRFQKAVSFNTSEIKQIRQSTGLSQVMFAGSLGVSPKTIEAWENGRNKPEGASRRLLEIVRDDPSFLVRFQA